MALVESLLTAIVRADGDALVMHVGENPYVVASAGPIELSTQGLNLQAMSGMVAQLLPQELQRTLTEFGAVEHELPSSPVMAGDRFTVVVARGGDDVWIELRRHRQSSSTGVPVEVPVDQPSAVEATPDADVLIEPTAQAIIEVSGEEQPVEQPVEQSAEQSEERLQEQPEPRVAQEEAAPAHAPPFVPTFEAVSAESEQTWDAAPEDQPTLVEEPDMTPDPERREDAEPAPLPYASAPAPTSVPAPDTLPEAGAEGPFHQKPEAVPGVGPSSAAVIPMTRTLRIEVPPPSSSRRSSGPSQIERLLGLAATQGATALYLTTQAVPFLRMDDDVQVLEGEPRLSATDVESAVLELMPETTREVLRRGDPIEWVAELADVGRVRCSTFRDYRGPGAIFQLISVRPVTAAQLGLSPDIQALATETEGFVLVASPKGHGKTTLLGALVDLINHQRPGYVISVERQIRFVHEHHRALISQREVRGTVDQAFTVACLALRENPDVLVIDDLLSPEMLQVAVDAMGAGRLVLASVTAPSTTAALTRIVELFPLDKRKAIQSILAERLRGAVAQSLLRKPAGGRVAARELVLPTAAVTAALADGQLQNLPFAIENGRKHGLVSLTDAMVQFVRNGTIDAREAYRKADDREALLLALKRENVDTSVVERLA